MARIQRLVDTLERVAGATVGGRTTGAAARAAAGRDLVDRVVVPRLRRRAAAAAKPKTVQPWTPPDVSAGASPRDARFHNGPLGPRDARFNEAPLGPRDARFNDGPPPPPGGGGGGGGGKPGGGKPGDVPDKSPALAAYITGAAGVAGVYAAASYATDVLGSELFGERPEGYSWMQLGGRTLSSVLGLHPMDQMVERDGTGGLYATMLGGFAVGAVGGRWATQDMVDDPAPQYDAAKPTKATRRKNAWAGAKGAARAPHKAVASGARRLVQGLPGKAHWSRGALTGAIGAAGAALAVDTVSRMSQAVVAQAPQGNPPSYQARARTRQTSTTGGRVARQAGVAVSGDLVHQLHRTNGRGMVIR